jgi:hypothetical protein
LPEEIDRVKAHDIASEMFRREHDRWGHFVFFLGAPIAVFLVSKDINGDGFILPRAAVFLGAATGSFVALIVGLSVRGTTDAWRETIRKIELSSGSVRTPFELFQAEVGGFSYIRDLLETLHFVAFFLFLALPFISLIVGGPRKLLDRFLKFFCLCSRIHVYGVVLAVLFLILPSLLKGLGPRKNASA